MTRPNNPEKITRVDHFGIGLPSIEAVEAFRQALMARGAELMPRSNAHQHKYFLRFNPGDTLLLEIFVDPDGLSTHVDYSVTNLEGVRAEHGDDVIDYGIPDMLFVNIPGVPDDCQLLLQLGFAKR